MAGRCDILSGYAHAACNHDPENDDSMLRVNNTIRDITNARNAIIFDVPNASSRAISSRKAPDISLQHYRLAIQFEFQRVNLA